LNESREIRVGIVFFLGLAFLLVLTVIIGRGELKIHRGYYTIDALFEHIQGLRKNDVVELSGMEIGRVDSIELDGDFIRVGLRIDEKYNLRKDSKIIIADRSLIGGKVVSVEMGEGEETLEAGSTVFGETSPTPVELIKQASGFAEGLENKLEEAGSIIPELQSLIASLKSISEAVETGKGTVGKLIKEDKLYGDMEETLKTAKSAAGEISEYTKGLARIKTYLGVDSAHNFDASRTLTGVFLRVEPRPEKLYILGGKALTGGGTEWSEEDSTSLELDAQIGRRWLSEKLTGRIGLFESRVGAGLDYRFNDRFSITVEGRDVWTEEKNEGISPFLLRGRLNFMLVEGVYIHAGADNILDGAAFNAGLKLEYSDEDIKHFVGLLSLGK
jgi:hypothetical protein